MGTEYRPMVSSLQSLLTCCNLCPSGFSMTHMQLASYLLFPSFAVFAFGARARLLPLLSRTANSKEAPIP